MIQRVFACTGDCASCHQNLDYQKDKRHSAMLECKACHTQEKMKDIKMGNTCGSDCFECHDVKRLQKGALKSSHAVIADCISCHKDLSKQVLNKSPLIRSYVKDFFMQEKLESKNSLK